MKMFMLVAVLMISAVYFSEVKAGSSASCSDAAVASCSVPEAVATKAKLRRTPVRSFLSKIRATRAASCSGN